MGENKGARIAPVITGVITGVIIGTGGVVWGITERDRQHNDQAAAAPSPKAELSTAQHLRSLASASRTPIYWAGAMPKRALEVTRANGNVTVRYLMPGTPAGLQKPRFLLVGSYPMRNAFAAIKRASGQQGAIVKRLSGGGLAVTYRRRPTNTFFARPGSKVQVEVFDPRPYRAQRWIVSGRIKAIAPTS